MWLSGKCQRWRVWFVKRHYMYLLVLPRSFFSWETLQCVEIRNIYIIYMYIYIYRYIYMSIYIYTYILIHIYIYIMCILIYIYVLYILYYVYYVYLYILYVFIIMCIPGKPWNTILLFSQVKIEFWFFLIFIWLPHGQPHPITNVNHCMSTILTQRLQGAS